jgi:hypothetical protein
MERYRITTMHAETEEQTWVLLPDLASATMQAEELAQREKTLHVRVYREAGAPGQALEKSLAVDLPPGGRRRSP